MFYVGIDWSDSSLEYQMRDCQNNVLVQGSVTPDVEGMADLFEALEKHAPIAEIGIAIEATRGAWVQALLDRGYQVFPVNPKAAEQFRKALNVNGDKTDKIDGKVMTKYLMTFRDDLKPLRPDDPKIISLRMACQQRLRLVEERTAKINELKSCLKCYYPAFLGLFGGIDSQIALKFLRRYPTQKQMQALTEKQLFNWLEKNHYPCMSRFESMVNILHKPALKVEEHLQKACKELIRFLARSLQDLNDEIAKRDKQINDAMDKLPEANMMRSLPGAGKVLAPALLACIGRDPERFNSVGEARSLMGTAPVTKASGKSLVVHFRWGCWKFGRRTMQLFADKSRFQCAWAQRFYQEQRASGHRHHTALRALANKWLKILLAMKESGQCYVEDIFTHSQRRYLLNKPLVSTLN